MNWDTSDGRKILLNVGAGPRGNKFMPPWLATEQFREVRLDIEPANQPDILCSAVDMKGHVPDASVDLVWAGNVVEHVYAHEAVDMLREFARVIKPDGLVHILVPNLQRVAQLVAEDKLLETAFESPSGPVAAIDMIFGYRAAIAAGELYMAHKTGFTPGALRAALIQAGLSYLHIYALPWDLLALASTRMEIKDHPMLPIIEETLRQKPPPTGGIA